MSICEVSRSDNTGCMDAISEPCEYPYMVCEQTNAARGCLLTRSTSFVRSGAVDLAHCTSSFRSSTSWAPVREAHPLEFPTPRELYRSTSYPRSSRGSVTIWSTLLCLCSPLDPSFKIALTGRSVYHPAMTRDAGKPRVSSNLPPASWTARARIPVGYRRADGRSHETSCDPQSPRYSTQCRPAEPFG